MGNRLDTSLAEMPAPETIRERSKAAGVELRVRGERNALALDAYDLTLNTELELPDGRLVTVEAASSELPEGGKLRCQAPFRESSSFAAFLRRGKDGRLCVHDVGTGTTHWLNEAESTANEFEDLDAKDAAEGKAPSAVSSEKPERFRIYTVDEIVSRPSPTWHVHGVVPDGGLVLIIGQSGSGKSFFTTDIGVAIAGGIDWRTE